MTKEEVAGALVARVAEGRASAETDKGKRS
jgi:hypothetical protein